MSKFIRVAFFLALIAGLIGLGAWWYFVGSQPLDLGDTVTIKDTVYSVEVANTIAKRATGLQHRATLEDKHGMLFIFDELEYHSFWMKNTLIPLDFVWIDGTTIVDVTENVPTQIGEADKDLTKYTSNVETDKVIEFPAGTIQRYGISVGNQVEF